MGKRGTGWRAIWAWSLALGCAACAHEAPPPAAAPVSAPVADSKARSRDKEVGRGAASEAEDDDGGGEASPPPPRAADPRPSAKFSPADLKKKPPPVSPAEMARARKLLEKGLLAYRKGDYDRAEDALKQAMTIYPFLAEANLALGKIFLIRGSATLDRSLINNARLMFEMAHTLDPNLHETDLLLELFRGEDPP